MIDPPDEKILDRWLADFDQFKYDFLKYCKILGKTVGFDVVQDQAALKEAHDSWCARCTLWKDNYVNTSKELSHLKILSILLFQLSHFEWVKDIFEWDSDSEDIGWSFRGSASEREELRKDINAGRGTYLAFQFVLRMMSWYETARIDRVPFTGSRITADLEHDILVYLLSERREEMATYLILKALYIRESVPVPKT